MKPESSWRLIAVGTAPEQIAAYESFLKDPAPDPKRLVALAIPEHRGLAERLSKDLKTRRDVQEAAALVLLGVEDTMRLSDSLPRLDLGFVGGDVEAAALWLAPLAGGDAPWPVDQLTASFRVVHPGLLARLAALDVGSRSETADSFLGRWRAAGGSETSSAVYAEDYPAAQERWRALALAYWGWLKPVAARGMGCASFARWYGYD